MSNRTPGDEEDHPFFGVSDPEAQVTRWGHSEEEPPATYTYNSRAAMRRAYAMTALGTVIPGAGLAMTRRPVTGFLMMLSALAGLVALSWYVLGRGAEETVLSIGSRPQVLQQVSMGASAIVIVWILSIAFTAITLKPAVAAAGQRVGLTIFTGLMCLLLAAPTAFGWRYVNAHTKAVEKIFVGSETPNEANTPNVEMEDPWEGIPRVNVLLLGSDADDTREGIRTDTMLIASIDTQTGDSVLFGIPRNLEFVPIPTENPLSQRWPNGYDCGDECLMNGIWTEAVNFAEERPELYTDDDTPGLTATREILSAVIDQPIDYTVIVNLKGFRDLVDAMGGVEINVKERLPMGGRTTKDAQGAPMLIPGSESGFLEPGLQKLSGYQAMWYARSRVTTDDFSRMRRQRCVVAAVVDQVNPLTMAQRYPQIVGVAGDNVTADISQGELPAFASLVLNIQKGTIESLPFTLDNTNVANPDYPKLQQMVRDAIAPPAPEPEPAPDPAKETAVITDPEPVVPVEEDSTGTAEPTSDELEEVGAVC